MNTIIAKLEKWGCDIKGTMKRMDNDEEFYIECLHYIAEDSNFDILKIKLDIGDVHGAFDAAHTLKGILANVGLTPMYNKIVEIVEPLRHESIEDLSKEYAELIEMKKHLEDVLDSEGSED